MIKGITFDFWNTLFSDKDEYIRTGARIEYCHKVINNYKSCSIEQVEKAFIETRNLSAQSWKDNYRTLTGSERLENILSIMDVSIPAPEFEKTVKHLEEVSLTYPPNKINGVSETIRDLCRDYKLGIISDTGFSPGVTLRNLLKNEGIFECFRSLNFSDEVGAAKPHPKIFNKAAEELNLLSNEIVHIGDLYRTDVKGALDNGFSAIHFTGTNDREPVISDAEYKISNLNEIRNIISLINSR